MTSGRRSSDAQPLRELVSDRGCRLTTNRTYRVALAGFTVGEVDAVFSTSRAEVRMVRRCRLKQVFASKHGINILRFGALTQCPCLILCNLTTC
jgi:hypothetical protein